jgi:hypothetical protein
MKAKEKLTKEYIEQDVQVSSAEILYNCDVEQTIKLVIEKGNRKFEVSHKLAPLTDERYFTFAADVEKKMRQAQDMNIDVYETKETLWNDLALEITGYAKEENWKQTPHIFDKIHSINAIVFSEVFDDEAEETDEKDLPGRDFLTRIKIRALQSATLVGMTHFIKEESKADLDEFLRIQGGAPPKIVLATAAENSPVKRLCKLYDKLCAKTDGYAGRVPAWQKVEVISNFFNQQLSRLGKF